MKSAWERALEKLDDAGIDRPEPDSVSDAQRARFEDIRSKADAALAELEIMHNKNLANADPAQRKQLEDNYHRDRTRIESKREGDLAKARS